MAAATLALALVLSQYLAWAYLYPMTEAEVVRFIAAEAAVALVYAAVALAGRQASIRIDVGDSGLRIERGDESLFVPFTEIRHTSIISAQKYHGHYARYAATRAFVNRLHSNLLMLECPGRPVILGVQPDDLLELERVVAEGAEPSYASTRMGAA